MATGLPDNFYIQNSPNFACYGRPIRLLPIVEKRIGEFLTSDTPNGRKNEIRGQDLLRDHTHGHLTRLRKWSSSM